MVQREAGLHAGADERMLAALFAENGDMGARGFATGQEGALAVAMGEAVTRSSKCGSPISLCNLLAQIYPEKPGRLR